MATFSTVKVMYYFLQKWGSQARLVTLFGMEREYSPLQIDRHTYFVRLGV
jgi:hypothetical protein